MWGIATAACAAPVVCARHASRTGSIVGLAVTFEAIGKMIGPAAGAPVLSALLGAFRLDGVVSAVDDMPSDGHAGPIAVPLLANGATATLSLFGAASFLCFLGAVALPRSVDGPRRSSLLADGPATRSDHVVPAED